MSDSIVLEELDLATLSDMLEGGLALVEVPCDFELLFDFLVGFMEVLDVVPDGTVALLNSRNMSKGLLALYGYLRLGSHHRRFIFRTKCLLGELGV